MDVTVDQQQISKYPAYKDSGEDWIGQIPSHWQTRRLKHLFIEKKIQRNLELNCGSISFGKVVYKDDEKIPLSTKASYQEVLEGEFLINPLNLNYDLISLRIALSQINVVVSSGYIVLKNRTNLVKDYYKYLLHRYDVAYMKLLGSGVRQTISFNHIANSLIVFPPLPEQTAIANFLDKKTTLIDQAIQIKEKQIDLLKERRQILIHQVVTRGLDPTVKLKDSGVEWIGMIPEHWEVKRLKNLGNIVSGYAFPSDGFKSEGTRVLKISNIQTMNIDWSDESYVDDKLYERLPKFQIKEGDLVFALTRPIISTGIKASIVPPNSERILLNQRNSVLKPKNPIHKYWLYFVILDSGFRQEFNNQIDFTGQQPNISPIDIGNLKIPLPPVAGLQLIIDKVELALSKADQAISLQQIQIEKLKEYKATLINSAVTGKIKVNGI